MVRAMFPGTFDPIHYGHIDIARRAARLFDEVLMAVYDVPLKTLMFSPTERMQLVAEALQDQPRIKVMGYSGLTVDFARKMQAQVIVRGLRVFSDFEFEFRMALANQRIGTDIETVALITAEQHTFLSSSTVKEIATLDGDVSSMVPPFVHQALRSKVTTLGDQQSPPNALRD
ncbi:MAG TPA: pantetheine-phosphate adenylyltransferase [Anaerolineales bacterium]|jgi:pantetheine-phosphate adenylyltransferase|nr:pantetheine-phosphate adenylyltransferase [Anaerolineales bacterium]